MKNSDLYALLYCEEDIRTSLDELFEGGKLSGKGELRLQTACAVAASLITYQGATNLPSFRELHGQVLAHEAGHLLVAVEKALKAETEFRETMRMLPSWGGAAATGMAINASLKGPPEPVSADSLLNCPRMGVYKARVLSGGAGSIYDRIHEFECTSQKEAEAEAARLATETMVQWDGDFADEPLLLTEFISEWREKITHLPEFEALRPDQTPVVYVTFSQQRDTLFWSRTSMPKEAQEARAAVFPPEGFQERLRTLAAGVSGPLVPAGFALPAFRDAVYALSLELPRFALPGDFTRLTEDELRHEAHHLIVYAAMCLRQWGSKADRQVAAICESLAHARFPKLP